MGIAPMTSGLPVIVVTSFSILIFLITNTLIMTKKFNPTIFNMGFVYKVIF